MEQLMYRCTAYWIIIFNQNNKSYPQILILNLCQSVKVDGGYNQNIHRDLRILSRESALARNVRRHKI